MTESRTHKSIKNSIVALGFYVVNLVLQFFSRKIFIDYLGMEILGLNTTATNILQFLNLAELGIGTAVGFSLYKPLNIKDQTTIIDIITFQGLLYKKIGLLVIGGAILVMIFFPWIFNKMNLPLWYAYASFITLLFSALLGYFVNYKQILLSANQQDYIIQYSYKSVMLIKVVIQILCMQFLVEPYITWLICEIMFSIFGSISLSKATYRSFPYLNKSKKTIKELRNKYHDIETKVKQIFYHQISGFVLTQTAPLIIYAYIDLTEVTLYGNYNLIIAGIISLSTAVFNSLIPGIGNFIISANSDETIMLFRQLFSIRFLFGSIACYAVYNLSQDFIALWIGKDFLLPDSTLAIMTLILFMNIIRLGAGSFLSAMGMYSDIWAPIIEAVLNLSLSVFLGYFWGLNGILLGILISLIVIPIIWKSYYLFRCGFKVPYINYVIVFVKHVIVTLIIWSLSNLIITNFNHPFYWNDFIMYSIEVILLFGILLSGIYVMLGFEFKSLLLKLGVRIWTK